MFQSIGLPELIVMSCVGLPLLAGVGAVVYFVVRGNGRRRRPCPYCAELILAEATVCRFCGRDIPPQEASQSPEA